MSDDQIASLDSDWSVFLPKEQAAFALARKLTVKPYAIDDADVDALRAHFSDKEIVELVLAIARFNSTTRWTDALGIPQDQRFRDGEIRFDEPTSERFVEAPSVVAPSANQRRPPLESRAEVEASLCASGQRSARVALATEEEAQAALPSDWGGKPVPQCVRALAFFPDTCRAQVASPEAMANEGRLDKLLKAQVAWTCARQDRAWYALAIAQRRLAALGLSTDEMFDLDVPPKIQSPATREALMFAAKLTSVPHTIADADIARLRRHYSDHETAEIVYVVCASNFFDRFTETLGLKSDD